ncbi:MAG: DUF3459 domain-containing protein, partial [Deltaproteobacteria bacterium]
GTIAKVETFPNATGRKHAAGWGAQFYANRPEVHQYLQELAKVYRPGFVTVGEVAFGAPDAALRFADQEHSELREVFIFGHVNIDWSESKFNPKPFDLMRFKQVITGQQKMAHQKAWLGNYLENHDQLRAVSRFGDAVKHREASGKVLATMLMTLEGTPFIYQGQEIGMTNLDPAQVKSIDEVDDIEARSYYHAHLAGGEDGRTLFAHIVARNRDNVRSVMQWDNSPYAGFSAARPAMPVNANFSSINVAASNKDPRSLLNFYRQLIALRKTHPSWVVGTFENIAADDPHIFAYRRDVQGESSLVLLNFSGEQQRIRVAASAGLTTVRETYSSNGTPGAADSGGAVVLGPWEARVYVGSRAVLQACAAPGALTPPAHLGWASMGK